MGRNVNNLVQGKMWYQIGWQIRADERTMGTDQTHANITHVDETPLRSQQSTSRSTVYRSVNAHMSEFPRTYADIVDKQTTSTTPKRRTELERRGLNRKLYNEDTVKPIDEGIKLIVEDAKTIVNIRNFRSNSCLVLSCLYAINTIRCFIQVSYWLTIQNMLLNFSEKFNFSSIL